jgi:hypothetical protein
VVLYRAVLYRESKLLWLHGRAGWYRPRHAALVTVNFLKTIMTFLLFTPAHFSSGNAT